MSWGRIILIIILAIYVGMHIAKDGESRDRETYGIGPALLSVLEVFFFIFLWNH